METVVTVGVTVVGAGPAPDGRRRAARGGGGGSRRAGPRVGGRPRNRTAVLAVPGCPRSPLTARRRRLERGGDSLLLGALGGEARDGGVADDDDDDPLLSEAEAAARALERELDEELAALLDGDGDVMTF